MRQKAFKSVFCKPHLTDRICLETHGKQDSISGQRLKRYLAVLVLVFMLIGAITTVGIAETQSFEEQKKTIVIDPGHGGRDKGARGPEGTFEKTVVLSLARMIASELETKYKVVLTRSDDYRLNLPNRTSTANNLKADLFISLHTGGSFLHKANGITIFYFKEISAPPLTLDTARSRPLKNGNIQTPWSNIQSKHKATGKVLAHLIPKCLNEQIKIKVRGAPLMVLEGADMPAILIEIGYLTNPAEEKKLNDTRILSDFAKGIYNGIDNFFSKNNLGFQ